MNEAPQPQEYVRIFEKVLPSPGQAVGPSSSSSQVSTTIAKDIVEALKSGDTQKYYCELQKHGVEPRNVIDVGSYNQNLLYAAALIKNEDQAIEMAQKLIREGVDPTI